MILKKIMYARRYLSNVCVPVSNIFIILVLPFLVCSLNDRVIKFLLCDTNNLNLTH